MFDYHRIEAYAAVIQEGGFEKAAAGLHITQSAVSQRIKQLEEQFGRIILLRTTPPQPTPFGKKILRLYYQVSRLEDDFQGSIGDDKPENFTSLPIGINADTLATWFFEAVQPFLGKNRVVLDLMVDDQEETHRLLKDGKVLGCISTRRSPLQGCNALFLGHVEYGIFCSVGFRKKWFGDGLNVETVRRAPMITFNRKDRLNTKILKRILGEAPVGYSTFYVPSAEVFMDFIVGGLAYGAVPDQQSRQLLEEGIIMDLAPEHKEKVPLYWHYWNLDSDLLRQFSAQLAAGFQRIRGGR
jgi:LysR family transcriptional regulator (chromosome initiation inhibitor)